MGRIDNIDFSDQSVTAWGGMKLMKDRLDATGIKEELSRLPFLEKGSNHGYEQIKYWNVSGQVSG